MVQRLARASVPLAESEAFSARLLAQNLSATPFAKQLRCFGDGRLNGSTPTTDQPVQLSQLYDALPERSRLSFQIAALAALMRKDEGKVPLAIGDAGKKLYVEDPNDVVEVLGIGDVDLKKVVDFKVGEVADYRLRLRLLEAKDHDVQLFTPPPPSWSHVFRWWHQSRGNTFREKSMKANWTERGYFAEEAARAFEKAHNFRDAGEILLRAGYLLTQPFTPPSPTLVEDGLQLLVKSGACYEEGRWIASAAHAYFLGRDFGRATLLAEQTRDHQSPREDITPEVLITLSRRALLAKEPAVLDLSLLATLQRSYAIFLRKNGLNFLSGLHFLDAAYNALAAGSTDFAYRSFKEASDLQKTS